MGDIYHEPCVAETTSSASPIKDQGTLLGHGHTLRPLQHYTSLDVAMSCISETNLDTRYANPKHSCILYIYTSLDIASR